VELIRRRDDGEVRHLTALQGVHFNDQCRRSLCTKLN
jgi:hypothetical protein